MGVPAQAALGEWVLSNREVAAMQKVGYGQANGVRLDGTGSVSVPPLLRESTRSFHASWVTTRGYCLKGHIKRVARNYENGFDHFDSTCFVATVQFWRTVKWHFFGGHQVQ
jgi:hypothetical protein